MVFLSPLYSRETAGKVKQKACVIKLCENAPGRPGIINENMKKGTVEQFKDKWLHSVYFLLSIGEPERAVIWQEMYINRHQKELEWIQTQETRGWRNVFCQFKICIHSFTSLYKGFSNDMDSFKKNSLLVSGLMLKINLFFLKT